MLTPVFATWMRKNFFENIKKLYLLKNIEIQSFFQLRNTPSVQ